jgi:hypothetical protein
LQKAFAEFRSGRSHVSKAIVLPDTDVNYIPAAYVLGLRGLITIAGQEVPVAKPRVRYTDDRGAEELERYGLLQSPDALPQAALDHLL